MSKSPSGPAAAVLAPTEVIAGRYRIVSVLAPPAASALGTTYSVVDLAAGIAPQSSQSGRHELTLRVLADPGSAGGACSLSDEDRERLAQQAARLGAVRHPAVARTYELGLLAELGVFVAREPIAPEGQTLRDMLALRGGPLAEDEAILLCAQIAEALEAVHLQGACHLNLSPSCVYVYPDGSGVRLKVADFGLLPPPWAARVGEPGYLAPEQVDGPLGGYVCDHRTDQFALAVILYELLAGQPAFIAAADEDRRIILGRVRNEDPLPLAQSRGVEQALARALSRSRAVRFSSVRDFMRALGADVSGWSTGAAQPASSGANSGQRAPRVFLPMAVGAMFALLCLGGAVALRQCLWPPGGGVRLPPPVARVDLSTANNPGAGPDADSADVGSADAAPGVPSDGGADGDEDGGGDAGSSRDLAATPDLKGPRPTNFLRPPGLAPVRDVRVVPPAVPSQPPQPPQSLQPLQFGGDAPASLSAEQRDQLGRCVKMISPPPPYEVVLQNINDTLFVEPERSSPLFSSSQDFRDCLKLSVKGKIVPKVITMTRTFRKVP